MNNQNLFNVITDNFGTTPTDDEMRQIKEAIRKDEATQGTVKSAEEAFLLHLVDVVWSDAHEDESVPSTVHAKGLIDKARQSLPPNNEAMAPQSQGAVDEVKSYLLAGVRQSIQSVKTDMAMPGGSEDGYAEWMRSLESHLSFLERVEQSLLTTLPPQSEVDNGGWISVEDRLPERMQECLFTNIHVKDLQGKEMKSSTSHGWYDRDSFHSFIDPRDNWTASHWIPVPIYGKSSPGKATQSGGAMEVLRDVFILKTALDEYYRESLTHERNVVDLHFSCDEVWKRVSQLLSSPTSENKEK